MQKTTVYLPEELHRRLRERSRRTHRPQADIFRAALEGYLDAEPVTAPTSIGAGVDEEVTARTSEDWLRSHWPGR
jgi:predicted transcriptional regulator